MQEDANANLPAKAVTGINRLFHGNGITDSAIAV
jgi:hypothetical protein